MCFEFEFAYQQRRAEEARKELQRLEEERRAREQTPVEPAKPRDVEPAPV
jgi:hypothetical protein